MLADNFLELEAARMTRLTEQGQREIVRFIEADKPLPDKLLRSLSPACVWGDRNRLLGGTQGSDQPVQQRRPLSIP